MKSINQQGKNISFSYGLSIAQIIAGIPIALISLIVIAVGFANFRWTGFLYYALQLFMIPVCTLGAILTVNGARSYRFIQNCRRISGVMQYKNRESIRNLADATGQSLTNVVRDIRLMRDKKYLPAANIDFERCELVLSESPVPPPSLSNGDIILKEADRPSFMPFLAFPYAFLVYYIIRPYSSFFDLIIPAVIGAVLCALLYVRRPTVHMIAEKKYKALPPPEPKEIDTGNDALDDLLNAAVDHMEELNGLSLSITSEKMIKPVGELLATSRQIFAFVEKNPHKIKQIRQFMNYYLPTTIKLLQSYRDLSREPQKGENIIETLEKIEGSMAEISGTFSRELDNLYSDKAEDIEVDIDVMLAMMRQQGIKNDFGQNSQ